MITDAISTPGPASYPDAAVRAVNAGVDVVLFTDNEALSAAGFKQLLQAARRGAIKRATLQAVLRPRARAEGVARRAGAVRAKRQAKARQQAFAAAHRSLTRLTVVTGSISPKSVVASGHGLFFAQNMMYRHTITVYNRSFRLVKTIPDSVDLAKLGAPDFPGVYQGAPVEAAFTPDGTHAYVSNYSMYGPKIDARGARRLLARRRATTAASSTASTWRSCASTGRSRSARCRSTWP